MGVYVMDTAIRPKLAGTRNCPFTIFCWVLHTYLGIGRVVIVRRIATRVQATFSTPYPSFMSVITSLTLEQFRSLEAQSEGPRLEYWHGTAVAKTMPTWLHSALQRILADLFEAAGYNAAVELELRIDSDWQPKPDVAAALLMEEPYPTRPIEIVAEVLSPEDEPGRVIAKCRQYQRIGIGQIFVFDPQQRTAHIWNASQDGLVQIDRMQLSNGTVLLVSGVWVALDRKLKH
jgi:Uma2 family endonuclease